jgi:hypothetical protein
MWQGALRDPADQTFRAVAAAIDAREPISIELLYSDQVGAQRTISRFGLIPAGDDAWLTSVSRHWLLDRPGPRSEEDARAAAEEILRNLEAAQSEAEEMARD